MEISIQKNILNQLHFYHLLKSKKQNNNRKIIILNYDYFLQKRELKYLLNNFQTVVLIPLQEDIEVIYKKNILKNLVDTSGFVKIIYNPEYQEIFEDTLELDFLMDRRIEIQNVFEFCENELKKCYVSDNLYVKNPLIGSLNYFSLFPRIIKKGVDLFFGTLIYVFSQPLWILSAAKIHTESPGPIFYRQKRMGIQEREFTILKFRSMSINAERDGAQFSSKNDNRIFSWGKFMRSTRIDELPQLFNILRGELSLIGPRPERKVFVDSFKEEIPQYEERHAVKPGISGYAQIMYPYGSGAKDARHKLMYDLYYIKNWSLGLEIEILIRTFFVILFKRGM